MAKKFNTIREEAEAKNRKSHSEQEKLLPTHDSHADDETPDEMKKKNEEKSPADKLLPTHKSDAAGELPDDEKKAEKSAKKKADAELDGQKVADGAAKDGVQKKVVHAEAKEDEMEMEEEEEEKDLEESEMEDEDEEELEESEMEDEDEMELEEEEDEEEKEKEKKKMEERISSLFSGQNLSEDFQSKAATLFEVAVSERVSKIKEGLKEKAKSLAEKTVKKEVSKIVDHVDEYLDYIVQEWITENEVAIETGLRTEVTESIVSGFKDLLGEAGVEVPEEEEDDMHKEYEEKKKLEMELDKEVEKNIKLKKENIELRKEFVLRDASEDLAETEKERLRELVSNFSYDDHESFTEKVETIREHYLKKTSSSGKDSNETLLEEGGLEEIEEKRGKTSVDLYAEALSRTSKNKYK